jgi:predicted outer membrane repeat protein
MSPEEVRMTRKRAYGKQRDAFQQQAIVAGVLAAVVTLAVGCGDGDSNGSASASSPGDSGSAGESQAESGGASGGAAAAQAGGGEDGGSSGSSGSGGDAGSSNDGGSGTGAEGGAGAGGGGDGGGGSGGGGGSSGSGGSVPEEICSRPVDLVDTSSPDHVIGTGTASSCTFGALEAAVGQGGIITFDCGPDPVTIDVTAALQLPLGTDTTVDGGGLVILDGGRQAGRTNRIFEFDSPNFRATDTLVVLQGLTLQNAEAPAVDYTAPDPNNAACAYGYADGAGGAVYVRDGRLRVIDCVFAGNRAATPGPDTGGGAIYALGANELTVVGSRFVDNQGSNSGAVGLLHTEGTLVNSVFENNQATGTGANYAGGDAQGCPGVGHENQGGAGGNGTVIAIDGGADDHNSFCGCVFRGNQGNELGTVFRTPNSAQSRLTFDRCAFIDNSAASGGGAMYVQDVDLEILACSFSGNHSQGLGGAVRVEQGAHGSQMLIENSTFHGNYVDGGLGGALVFSCGDWTPTPPCGNGVVRNTTFAANEARGGEGFFAAAIVNHGTRRTLSIFNTIFLDNTDAHEWTPMTCSVDNPGTPAAMPGSGNLQWPRKRVGGNDIDDNPCTAGITWADALLGALADNGGPTSTMMPQAGSPALGAGSDCPAVDQRGQARPAQGCAAGAVEP